MSEILDRVFPLYQCDIEAGDRYFESGSVHVFDVDNRFMRLCFRSNTVVDGALVTVSVDNSLEPTCLSD